MKKSILLFLILLSIQFAQAQDSLDIWSGKYELHHFEDTLSAPINYIIAKNTDSEKPWLMYTLQEEMNVDTAFLEPFLFDSEDNEYEQFGWTTLHESGNMQCLDSGHFFICKTTPSTTVTIAEENFFTTTGMFGIMLHQGLFHFNKKE